MVVIEFGILPMSMIYEQEIITFKTFCIIDEATIKVVSTCQICVCYDNGPSWPCIPFKGQ